MARASSPQSQSERTRMLRRGEAMAMHPEAIRRGPQGFFFLLGPSIAPNERIGEIAIVNIRGPLEQFADCYGENYESIIRRVTDAMTGKDEKRRIKRERNEAYWSGEVNERDESPIDVTPPKACVLRFSSPGGVVAGLNETARKLRTLSEKHDIPLVAYVDEMAASAAYALACACDEIYLPASGVVGSIGVISHMWSVARANDEAGLDVTVIASGDQKTDGNENLPISDDAIAREGAKVDELAGQFFRLVASARPISADEVEALQAGVFIGKDGAAAGLADDVLSWDSFLELMGVAYGGSAVTSSGSDSTHEGSMTQIKALIAETRAALRTAKGETRKALQAKLSRLEASLADLKAYKKTKYVKEEETSEEDGDDPESEDEDKDEDAESDDDDKDAESDDDKKESKSEKKSDKDAKGAKSEKDEDAEAEESNEDAESDDDDKDAESDASEEESMALLTSHLNGKAKEKVLGMLSGLMSKAAAFDRLQPTVAQLQATERKRERNGLIDAALKGRRITKAHAKMLREKKLAFVKDFLAMHKKPLYFTEDEALAPGEGGPDAVSSTRDVPEFILSVIDASVQQTTSDPKKQADLRAAKIKEWRDLQSKTNGVTAH